MGNHLQQFKTVQAIILYAPNLVDEGATQYKYGLTSSGNGLRLIDLKSD